jgi:hypothetical protein
MLAQQQKHLLSFPRNHYPRLIHEEGNGTACPTTILRYGTHKSLLVQGQVGLAGIANSKLDSLRPMHTTQLRQLLMPEREKPEELWMRQTRSVREKRTRETLALLGRFWKAACTVSVHVATLGTPQEDES